MSSSGPNVLDLLRVGTTTDFDALGGTILAQSLAGATPGTVLTCGQNQRILISHIVIVNTGATPRLIKIYHSEDGTAVGIDNMIHNETIAANSSTHLVGIVAMTTPGAIIDIEAAAANEIACTFYGGYHDLQM